MELLKNPSTGNEATGNVIPEALVIGAGIAGMQASLDLADKGFLVHLIEKAPCIGGHMAQLDKTFPTLDCAACTITPRMVETANHDRIRLYTLSEVIAVAGEAGNFRVTIRKNPRYVDLAKCTGCGLCFPGCPVVMKSEFDLGLAERRAIYTPFPQAVPNKATIDKREERPCKAACMDRCPVHTNVLGYVKLIAEGRFREAYDLNRRVNPFPSVCGRVCYAPCEEVCNRGQLDEPVAIRQLKMFVADFVNIDELPLPQITKTGKKVAVIGAGPAGLAAANDLALAGHEVTVFEAEPEAGGMLRYAIPAYRLPKDELHKEIDYIERLGVEIKRGVRVGRDIPFSHIRETHQAVFLGVGAPAGMKLEVEGADLPGVIDGITFLKAVNAGEKIHIGKTVAVIGGGNTALDSARTAKRLGAEDVRIVYRRSRAEMPAAGEEIAALEAEGIVIDFLTQPGAFRGEGGKLSRMECIAMALGDPDEAGRRRPVPLPGSESAMPVDTVITALGQVTEVGFLKDLGLSLRQDGTLMIDPQTGATSLEGIFAGGDVATGAGYVIDAIAAGKRAAQAINLYLRGEPLARQAAQEPEQLSEAEVTLLKQRFAPQKRTAMKELPAAERIDTFQEVALGFDREEAVAEAMRCLAGQIEGCIGCGECSRRCDPQAILFQDEPETREIDVGAIVVATGFDPFDPRLKPEFGYGRYPQVLQGLELERLCSASGPTKGEIIIQGKKPQDIVFVHCVGSRDKTVGNEYCSRVCCMYTAKQAHLIREKLPDARITVLYMDVRAFGKGFEEFYERVQHEGIRYRRANPSEIYKKNGRLIVRGEDTLMGVPFELAADLVVLAAGLVPRQGDEALQAILGLTKSADGFYREAPGRDPIVTLRPGIFLAGACQGPKDIPDAVAQASGAAALAAGLLAKGKTRN